MAPRVTNAERTSTIHEGEEGRSVVLAPIAKTSDSIGEEHGSETPVGNHRLRLTEENSGRKSTFAAPREENTAWDSDNKDDGVGGTVDVTNKQDGHVPDIWRRRTKGIMDRTQEHPDLGNGNREGQIVKEQRKGLVDGSGAKIGQAEAKAVAVIPGQSPVLDNWVQIYLPWSDSTEADRSVKLEKPKNSG